MDAFDECEVIWLPKSKTVTRKIRLLYSSFFLSAWISDHPLKNPESLLWIKFTGRNVMKAIAYDDKDANKEDSKNY